MLDAEKNVAAADYTKSLADLEKKLLEAQYKKATAELSKRTETDAAALAELEKQIIEADNTIRSGDLEKELLRVNYEKTLKELEAKYQPKKDSTSSGGSGSGSTGSNSDDLAAKINDLEKSYRSRACRKPLRPARMTICFCRAKAHRKSSGPHCWIRTRTNKFKTEQ